MSKSNYRCIQCGKEFFTRIGLQVHQGRYCKPKKAHRKSITQLQATVPVMPDSPAEPEIIITHCPCCGLKFENVFKDALVGV